MASELTPVPDDLDFGVTVRGLVVSQQVFGRYQLKHVLGRGGMGVVWLAHDERLDRDVALKFLPEAVHFDAGALDDLKRETRRCLELTHPNIIRIYDFVTDQQAAAISMEYVDGKTLASLRIDKENRVFDADELRDWIGQVCGALYYAHEDVKVVHRDLKPANLMVTSRGQIKIADFGIARSVSDSMTQVTMRRATSGTLVYMSPQQMNGDMSRIADDIYALGATIYEFFTSKPPFYSGDIPFQVRQSIPRKMSERREELGIEGAEIPKEWEETVAACLEKVPEQRPRDMMEIAERLGLPVGTRSTRSTQDAAKSSSAATKTAPAKTQKAPPLPKAPKPPRKPLPWKLIGTIAGGAVAVCLFGWLLWAFVIWPYVATPGELLVTSDPVGATVHVSGQTDRVTPADFDKVHIGTYKVMISLLGYDPVDATITITEGGKASLDNIKLKRTFGKLNLTTQPARLHYTLTGVDSTADTTKEGTTPDSLSNIPAGKYQLALSGAGIDSFTQSIEVPAHDTLNENVDLIKQAIAANASPDPGKVFLGQLDAGQLDAKGKSELVGMCNQAFTKYLDSGLLASAASQLTQLKGLGQDTTAQDKQLADKRTDVEKDTADQLTEYIDDKEFAKAQQLLQSLNGVLEQQSIDKLTAQFGPRLTQYQQQVDAAIKMSQNGPPAQGYTQLKTFADQYPNDLTVQLALAQLQTEMPPDHDKLTAQLKTFKSFAAANKDAVVNPDFQAMQDKFATELKTLDELKAELDAAKNGPAATREDLASEQEKLNAAQNKRVGYVSDPTADTVNLFGHLVTGHDVVRSGSYFETQADKDQEVASIQARINADQEKLAQPQGDVDEAQRRYDDFVAHVPW